MAINGGQEVKRRLKFWSHSAPFRAELQDRCYVYRWLTASVEWRRWSRKPEQGPTCSVFSREEERSMGTALLARAPSPCSPPPGSDT